MGTLYREREKEGKKDEDNITNPQRPGWKRSANQQKF